MNEGDIRSLAVEVVDAVHGHTMEFCWGPEQHEALYDQIEDIIQRRLRPPPPPAEHVDRYGRIWSHDLGLDFCPDCLQPTRFHYFDIESGHPALTMENVLLLGGRLPPEPQLPFPEEP